MTKKTIIMPKGTRRMARLEAKIARSKEKLAAIESMLQDCKSEPGRDSAGSYDKLAESAYKKRLKRLLCLHRFLWG